MCFASPYKLYELKMYEEIFTRNVLAIPKHIIVLLGFIIQNSSIYATGKIHILRYFGTCYMDDERGDIKQTSHKNFNSSSFE
jgi:hypothetical protein